MVFKLNISEKESSWKLEVENESFIGLSIGAIVKGKDISKDLDGYELEITGASDIAGFPHKKDVEGSELKKVLLTKGWGMHKKPRKEGKKKVQTPKGLRLRKTVRGRQISDKTVQINLKIKKSGSKSLKEIFPEQNKPKEKKPEEQKSEPKPENKAKEKEAEKPKAEEKPVERTEEKKEVQEESKEEMPVEIAVPA